MGGGLYYKCIKHGINLSRDKIYNKTIPSEASLVW